jgi:predicted transglutaminase-like cysteine proteinase
MNKLIATFAFTLMVAAAALPQGAQARTAETGALFLPKESALLQMVNDTVNTSHLAGSPLPSDPDGVWDCDNYALGKYRALRDDFNWSPRRMALAVARLPDGRKHMVVLVRGPAGWAILDNLTNRILSLSERERAGWKVQFAGVEPGRAGAAAWAMEPRPMHVPLRG